MFETENYDTISLLSLAFLQFFILAFIKCLDVGMCKYYSDKARWFQIHFIMNMFVTAFCVNDITDILYDVNESYKVLPNHIAGSIALQLHIYHTLFFELSTIDKYHHISSVFLCFPPSLVFNRKILSLFYFIGTGLPGGINYLLLTLVKNGQMGYLEEKKWSSYINAYIRMPGGAVCSFLTLSNVLQTDDIYAKSCGAFLSFIVFSNTAYFGKLAIENHTERLTESKLEKEIKET